MRVTIKEIADIAEVSAATVSLALNNKPGINEATRQRILKISQSLEERNRKNATKIIKGSLRFVKVVKHAQVLNRDHDLFISRYIDGMEQEAREDGYNLEINTFTTTDIGGIIPHIQDASIDGLIVLGTEFNDHDFAPFDSMEIPVIILDTNFDFKKFDFVDMDNIEAVFQIVHHFIEHKHRDIGMVSSPVEVKNFELRYVGFQRALEYFGLSFNPKFVFPVNSTFDGSYQDMLRHIRKSPQLPTALFCVNDLVAYGCIKALKECGIRIPDEVSIIGFDDLPMSAMMDPPLTTIKVSQRQMGQMAVQLLLGRIDGNFSAPTMKINVGGRLISRDSVKHA